VSLIRTKRELQDIQRARQQQCFSFLRYSPDALLSDIRQRWFTHHMIHVEWFFIRRGPIACTYRKSDPAPIYIHELLNHEETPLEVMSLIFKHELLHHVIAPREVDGKIVSHPPEFCEKEQEIAPERDDAWLWINMNFFSCLKRRDKLERIDVLPTWKTAWAQTRRSIIELRSLYPATNASNANTGW
jgi:hypothetical protein